MLKEVAQKYNPKFERAVGFYHSNAEQELLKRQRINRAAQIIC